MSPRKAVPLKLEFIILGLAKRTPIYGYELLQEWQEKYRLDLIWRLKPGVLYAVLDKLEKRGLILQVKMLGVSSPPRKEYHLSPAGEALFNEWLFNPVKSARDVRQEFMAKLFFMQDAGEKALGQLLDHQRNECLRWLKSLQNQREGRSEFESQVLLFRIRQVEAIIEWLDSVQHQPIRSRGVNS